MSDDQIKSVMGVEDTMQMLQFREQVKSQMTAEEWQQNMNTHKASLKNIMSQQPGTIPLEACEIIIYMLNADKSLDEDQREIWKALVLIAAFEMQELE